MYSSAAGRRPPCAPFSSLGHRRGWDDPRAQPLLKFFDLRDGLEQLCTDHGWSFVWVMEEVASMDLQMREHISKLAGHQPLLVHAGDWGHAHRARLFWGCQDVEALPDQAFADIACAGECAEGVHVARWLGRPSPRHWEPDDGYEVRRAANEGLRGPQAPGTFWAPTYHRARFSTLTTCFTHPNDRGHPDDETQQRFYQDGKRFPVIHYSAGNLVWKGSSWRTLSADEREVLMGFPQKYTAKLQHSTTDAAKQHDKQKLEDYRCHALGNSFRVPSSMLVLALLFHMPSMPNAEMHKTEVALLPGDRPEPDARTDQALWAQAFGAGSVLG